MCLPPSSLSTLVFETVSPQPCQLARLSSQQALETHLSLPTALGLQHEPLHLAFMSERWDLNSGLHACTTGTLLFQPLSSLLKSSDVVVQKKKKEQSRKNKNFE